MCQRPLRIVVQDRYPSALARAEARWKEAEPRESPHAVSFHTGMEALPSELDVAIVATTADARPSVAREIACRSVVHAWVLEKVLAQSESGLDELVSAVAAPGVRAWVNMPRRMMPWHRQIKAQLGLEAPLTLEVGGGLWGIACNTIHFLDLLAWWTGETLQTVRTDRLQPEWFESKRPGFWEVLGTVEAEFSGGTRTVLSADANSASMSIVVHDRRRSWTIDETDGLARRADGVEIRGRMAYQSEMTGTLVESILERGDCNLATLEESAALHRVFIRGMQEHWTRTGRPGVAVVPLT